MEKSKQDDQDVISLNRGKYSLGKMIGQGAFSSVYRGRIQGTNEKIAIKITDPRFSTMAADEYEVLKQIHKEDHVYNKYIINCIDGGNYNNGKYVIVMPEMFMSVTDFLDGENTKEMSAKHALTLAFQMLCALRRLHQCHVVHTDLKPDNILFSQDCIQSDVDEDGEEILSLVNPKFVVSDFNTGRRMGPDDVASGLAQTSNYRAPEVVVGMPWTQKIDIFSLGALLAETLTGDLIFCPRDNADPSVEDRLIHISLIEHCCGPIVHSMFEQSSIPELRRRRHTDSSFPPLNDHRFYPDWKRIYSDEECFNSAMAAAVVMLTVDPEFRPSAKDLLKMDMFKDFNEGL